MSNSKVRVLIVDDSATMRAVLSKILAADPEIEVIGTAGDAYIASNKVTALNPDVLTLDVEMPGMNGVEFLGKLMKVHPMPVVMVSSLTQAHCDTTITCLELGAVDFISKQSSNGAGLFADAVLIAEKVKAAGRTRIRRPLAPLPDPGPHASTPSPRLSTQTGASAPGTHFAPRPGTSMPVPPPIGKSSRRNIIAIGASTGGTQAITEVLRNFPSDCPGIVIVQHMPPGFTDSFARRLNQTMAISVKEAADGDEIVRGRALIAPGGKQMEVYRDGTKFRTRVLDGEPVNRHRPSVDYLFDSIAAVCAKTTVGAILTGMGNDGAAGMRRMHDAGAVTIAQDEESCVVFGMPKEAIKAGGTDMVVPLCKVGHQILEQL